MELVEEIKRIAESKLTDPSHFLVDVVLSSRKGPKKVLIVIDGDHGVTIDDCGNISRELSKAFDDSNLIDDSYMLEVSTPGLDHPLKLMRQYRKNIGRKLKVKLKEKIVEGQLLNVGDDNISLSQEIGSGKLKETSTIDIPFSEIEKAFVLVSFK